jgi:hypothetical protein
MSWIWPATHAWTSLVAMRRVDGDVLPWRGEAAVDAPDGLLDHCPQVAVLGDVVAAGDGDLDAHQPLVNLGAPLQQLLDGAQPLDPLGVVEPVDSEHDLPAAELMAQRVDVAVGGRSARQVVELLGVDGDRAGGRAHCALCSSGHSVRLAKPWQ